MVQNVAIVSERGEVKGHLKIALQELQSNDSSTDNQTKLMRTYRNASGMTKIVFDDETYFQVQEFDLIFRMNDCLFVFSFRIS